MAKTPIVRRPNYSPTAVFRSKGHVPNLWKHLPEHLLSRYGVLLVTNDPGLSTGTIKKLMDSDPPAGNVTFSFGLDDPRDDVGLAMLSMCINENTEATLAEVVTRYAANRNIPFTDAALAILDLKAKQGLIRYIGGTADSVVWEPKAVSAVIKFS